MPYKRRYSDEELLEIRRKNGRKGSEIAKANAAASGKKLGRPKLAISQAIPVKTIQVREPDYKIIVKKAGENNSSLVGFMHEIAKTLEHPIISRPAMAVFKAIEKQCAFESITDCIDYVAKKVSEKDGNEKIKAEADSECPFPPAI